MVSDRILKSPSEASRVMKQNEGKKAPSLHIIIGPSGAAALLTTKTTNIEIRTMGTAHCITLLRLLDVSGRVCPSVSPSMP